MIKPPSFELLEPASAAGPLIFSSPHSGAYYPQDLVDEAQITSQQLRSSEDLYVDDLLKPAFALGVPLLKAVYARAYIDMNRYEYDLDRQMFYDAIPGESRAGERAGTGLGSIARTVGGGLDIYKRQLSYQDVRHRIEVLHRRYHEALEALVRSTREAQGLAVLVDWHSMPSLAVRTRPEHPQVDFVVGDRFGSSCSGALVAFVCRELRSAGFTTALNTPYAGGYITQRYGRPHDHIHCLQIEINRALYVDETTYERSSGFPVLLQKIETLVRAWLRYDFRAMKSEDWSSASSPRSPTAD